MVVLLLPLSDLLVDWLFATLAMVTKAQTPPPNLPCVLLCGLRLYVCVVLLLCYGCYFCDKNLSIHGSWGSSVNLC